MVAFVGKEIHISGYQGRNYILRNEKATAGRLLRKRLTGLRKEKRWTYTYLSEHSGIGVGFLHALEHGSKEPCLNTIDILAKSFEMSISELMRGV